MTPSWVLLDTYVDLCFDEEDGEASASAPVSAAPIPEGSAAVSATAPTTLESMRNSTIAFLRSMTPDAVLHDPPKVSAIRLRSSGRRQDAAALAVDAAVACADKSLLVLYGGRYAGPGSSPRGCYLIYDAAVSSTGGGGGTLTLTSTVPPVPLSWYITSVGFGAVALRSPPPSSSYLLAELATSSEHQIPDAELYLWRHHSDDSPPPQWEKKAVRMPDEVCRAPGKHNFCVDTAFSLGASTLCWVDLLNGIVVYNDDAQRHVDHPHLRFVPLPDGCPAAAPSDDDYPLYRPCAQEFRAAAACATGGAIKLVVMEGYLEDWDSHEFRLVTWTLAPDLSGWTKDAVFRLTDIWASDRYLALKIPEHTPVCPVLSPVDDGVVYAVVNDVEVCNVHKVVKGSEVVETKVDIKGQYVLGIDVRRNVVVSTDCCCGGFPSLVQLTPRLLATDFCAWLKAPKDRQREVNASEVGESGKKPKVS
ncbi:hypothetical protein EJB05_24653, partial [Eragrostis curvula]